MKKIRLLIAFFIWIAIMSAMCLSSIDLTMENNKSTKTERLELIGRGDGALDKIGD